MVDLAATVEGSVAAEHNAQLVADYTMVVAPGYIVVVLLFVAVVHH